MMPTDPSDPARPAAGLRGALVAAAVASSCALASAAGVEQPFEHKDWELACDNTRTCRAAGYEHPGDANAVSLLLERAAGAAAVDVRVRIGRIAPEPEDVAPNPGVAALTIAGRPAGTVAFDLKTGEARLAPAQVAALLKALSGTDKVVATDGDVVFERNGRRWRVSGEGAGFALLKMDEFQGRAGTVGAVVRKGTALDATVPGPVAAPVVQAVRVPEAVEADAALAARVRATAGNADGDCALGPADGRPRAWRLDASHLLVGAPCWKGTINAGDAYWIANDRPPYDAKLVTSAGTAFEPSAGRLSSIQKGRAQDDCRHRDEWTWNGTEFVRTASASTGMCRLVAPGGAWDLPTLVSDVRAPR